MVTSEDRLAQVIEASVAAFTLITPTASVHFVRAPAVDLDWAAEGTAYPLRPAQLPQRLIAVLFADQLADRNGRIHLITLHPHAPGVQEEPSLIAWQLPTC